MTSMEIILNNRPPLPEDFCQMVQYYAMPRKEYIFTQKERGYCTGCHQWIDLGYNPRHGSREYCPNCKEEWETRKWNISRKSLVYWVSYAIIQPVGTDVYIRFFDCKKDYNVEPEAIHIEPIETEVFFCSGKKIRHFSRLTYYAYNRTPGSVWAWHEMRTMNESTWNYQVYPSPKNVMEGTCLEHCHLNDYWATIDKNSMKYLQLYLRYPNIEHLLGARLHWLVSDLVKHPCYRKLINWKGRRPRDMLGISQPELLEVIEKNYSMREFETWRKLKPAGVELSDNRIVEGFSELYGENLKKIERAGFAQCAKYMIKQMKKDRKIKYVTAAAQLLVDAWDMAEKLGYDLEQYRFPPKLREFHDKLTELNRQRKMLEEEKKRAEEIPLWEEQYHRLSPLCWEKDGLLIRPARSWRELVDEGAKLDHCVGSYADRVKTGQTHIFFIRKAKDPDTPYYTLNLNPKGEFIQCHGYKNDLYTPVPENVKKFWEEWLETVCKKFFKNKKAAKPAA